MFRKGLAVAVILLFIGVAFTSSINANVSKSGVEPIVDVDVKEDVTPIETNYQRIRELVQSIALGKIIVNPNAIIVSLEEISTIIEENEDCGCEDVSPVGDSYSIMCFLLAPLAVLSLMAWFMGRVTWLGELVFGLGGRFNCFWA